MKMQFAEKIHAYSYPREKRPFSRIRDLVDMNLIIEQGLLRKDLVKLAIEETFKRRGTHEIPEDLEVPPDNVGDTYAVMAKDCGVEKKTMKESFAFLQEYWRKLRTC